MLRLRSLATGVSTATLAHWERDGCDIEDDDSIRAHVATLTRLPKTLKSEYITKPEQSEETPDMAFLKTSLLRTTDEREARRLATQIKGLADAEKLEILQAKFISMEEAKNAFSKIGAATRAGIMRLQADLPPILYGMSAADMQKKIAEAGDRLLLEMSNTASEIFNDKYEDA